jgi:hypothetical protein
LSVRGRDYVYPGGSGGRLSNMKNEFTGCGPFLHDDPRDRPVAIYGGETTIHVGGGKENFVLLPIIPEKVDVVPTRRGARSAKAMLDEVVAAHRRQKTKRPAKRRKPAPTMSARRK